MCGKGRSVAQFSKNQANSRHSSFAFIQLAIGIGPPAVGTCVFLISAMKALTSLDPARCASWKMPIAKLPDTYGPKLDIFFLRNAGALAISSGVGGLEIFSRRAKPGLGWIDPILP